jgi:hypothetical protein
MFFSEVENNASNTFSGANITLPKKRDAKAKAISKIVSKIKSGIYFFEVCIIASQFGIIYSNINYRS